MVLKMVKKMESQEDMIEMEFYERNALIRKVKKMAFLKNMEKMVF